jgi:hypothetical protein
MALGDSPVHTQPSSSAERTPVYLLMLTRNATIVR